MPVDTHIDDAASRVRSERDAIEAKIDAIERFADRVGELSPEPTPPTAQRAAVGTGMGSRGSHSTKDRCRVVRRAFDETIRPHSVEDVDDSESIHETIRAEFSESLAVALAPTTETSFSPTLKRAILSEAGARRAETDVLCRALEREVSHLDDWCAAVDDITEWVATTDQTPLVDLGFDALRRRHETLAAHRDRCEDIARKRQAFLRRTTSRGGEIALGHENLIPYLYEDFPVDHPVLATVARLDETCADCQRIVRQRLVRRV